MKLLLIEDDRRVAAFLERGLTEEGHTVLVACTVQQARDALTRTMFDLMVCDRTLPDGDGLDLIRDRRGAGDTTPALVLTARDRVQDKVEGLYGGADDYLVKPFAFDELVARVSALGRRGTPPTVAPPLGGLRHQPDRRRVFAGEDELHLTALEYRLLQHFIENAGRVISRTRLLEQVWGLTRDPGSNVVDVYVRYLRNKLASAGLPPLIHTVRGRGFVLEERAT